MNDCSTIAGHACGISPCPGRANPGLCDHLTRLARWRNLTSEEQADQLGGSRPAIDPVVRDRVNSCEFRGSVLPISLQDDCGCRGKELSGCRAGRGVTPGRVTLRDCLECRAR